MATVIRIGEIAIQVTHKDIKNIHLSVYPPEGLVRISAPKGMAVETIRVFAIAKVRWIRKQQRKLREQERETPREFINRESHYLWGKRYLLKVEECDAPPSILLRHREMLFRVRPGADLAKRESVLDEWYRQAIKDALPGLLKRWERRFGVSVSGFLIRRMKTRWGTCTPGRRTVRLNLELAKKPPECLEYILVHEMVHLLEPTHNSRFVELMDMHIPKWRQYRQELNRLPVRHEKWMY